MTGSWLRADLGPGVTALVTTRADGVSRAPYEGLNVGLHVGDSPELVRANRAAVRDSLGSPVAYSDQVHGRTVRVVSEPPVGDSVGQGDALVTARPGLGLAVMVADCLPVLLADPEGGIAGVAHAGRRGLAAGVVPAAVEVMVALGAHTDRIRAYLGPAICGRCYEVGQEVQAQVAAAVPAAFATTAWGSPALDLAAGAREQLAEAGLREVGDSGICTYEDNRFYSFRRHGTTGRFAGVVVIDPGDTPPTLLAAEPGWS